ncbi:MAG: AAA family ATPase [Oscillospiraceae bacterium]|nr:AAA family ATPase [Oscillospiraceae bacterium]
MKNRIHLFGASGSGTTTIAKGICQRIRYKHFDTDNYFWLPANEPFTLQRPQEERKQLMENDLSNCDRWVLSGSLAGWGDIFIPLFDLTVFVYVPHEIRMERLKKREYERYGDRIMPGGNKYESSIEFLDWAASYDTETRTGRNLSNHKKWFDNIKGCAIKIVNESLEDSINKVIEAIN